MNLKTYYSMNELWKRAIAWSHKRLHITLFQLYEMSGIEKFSVLKQQQFTTSYNSIDQPCGSSASRSNGWGTGRARRSRCLTHMASSGWRSLAGSSAETIIQWLWSSLHGPLYMGLSTWLLEFPHNMVPGTKKERSKLANPMCKHLPSNHFSVMLANFL